MQEEAPKLDQQLVWMIARVNRRLEEELAERLRPRGVPLEQFRILEALSQRGPLTMGDLAAVVLVERPTLTKIIDRMVAAGLVFRQRDEQDRRKVNIALGPEGEALYAHLGNISLEVEKSLQELLEGRDAALRSFRDQLNALA